MLVFMETGSCFCLGGGSVLVTCCQGLPPAWRAVQGEDQSLAFADNDIVKGGMRSLVNAYKRAD